MAIAVAAWARFGSAAAGLVLGGCAAAWLLAPVAARIARWTGATVLPGGRSIHARPTPLLGGLALFVPVAVYLLATGGPLHVGLLVGGGLVFLVGAVDDIRGVTPSVKILAQVGAALALLGSGFGVPVLSFEPIGAVGTGGFEALLVVAWVVLVTNSINLIDGMDGLATTVTLVAAVACAALGLADGAALVLAGAALGFLRHNLSRARLFLGDAGSLLLGFWTAAFTLNGAAPVALPVAVGILALPLGDVFLATVRRWLRGKPIFAADRGHVHHLLIDAWVRPTRVLGFLGLFAGLQAAFVMAWPNGTGLAAVAASWAGLVCYLLWHRRQRWRRILRHRNTFRRLHVVRRYAMGSLALAEKPADVRGVLDRVALDLGLAGLRIRGLSVRRPAPQGVLVDEHVECSSGTAVWSAPYSQDDPVLFEEKRTVLCDLLRQADARLVALAPAMPAAAPAPPRPGVAEFSRFPDRPAAHFIVRDRDQLTEVTPIARATRRGGNLDALVVFTGRRDDLFLSPAQFRELDLEPPAVELDVEDGDAIVTMARVMERYAAFVETAPPALVVVDDSRTGAACAIVAKERGLPVAQLRGMAGDADTGSIPGATADLVLEADRGLRPEPGRQLRFGEAVAYGGTHGDAGDESAARVVPALESLVRIPSPS